MMIPLYGFLEGDTIGLLILAYENESIAELAEKLQKSARIRVSHKSSIQLIYKGKVLNPEMKLSEAGIEALERFDVIQKGKTNGI